MKTCHLPSMPPLETEMASRIGREYFNFPRNLNPQKSVKECIIVGNPAGYYCDFIYEDFDHRTLDFRQTQQELTREFKTDFFVKDEGPFGIRMVFYKTDPIYSEGYSLGNELPDDLSEFVIGEIREIL